MRKYKVRQKADADLANIYRHSIRAFGEQQTDQYIQTLSNSFQLLADFPKLGQGCDHISPGLLRFFPGETTHTIYFRVTGYGIDIVRVLHQMMDPDRQKI